MTDSVLVTGLGAVAPTGGDASSCWEWALDGKSGIDRITRFDPSGYRVTLAGEVRSDEGFKRIPGMLRAQTDRMTHFALTAAEMALGDAGVDPSSLPEYEQAVVISNGAGGTEFGQRELEKLNQSGPQHVGAYMAVAWFYAGSTGQVSIRHRMRGPCGVVVSEQAGGLDALGHGRRLLRRGARVALAGGTEAPLSPAGLVAQMSTRLLSESADPASAYLPFDRRACGYVPAEGAAVLVLETAAAARGRDADRPYGELAGYAATFDPPPGSPRPPALERALRSALADARVHPDEVDVVFADGYALPHLDQREADALAAVFGPYGVPVTVPRSAIGRLYAGSGPLDVVFAVLSIRDGVIPATPGVDDVAPQHHIDLVRGHPREYPVRCAVVVSRGYTGLATGHPTFNSVVVIRGAD